MQTRELTRQTMRRDRVKPFLYHEVLGLIINVQPEVIAVSFEYETVALENISTSILF
jgi:hypothetical protein